MSMTCLEARRNILADPLRLTEPTVAHIAKCRSCNQARQRAKAFDKRLQEALRAPAPSALAERILLAQATTLQGRQRRHRAFFALAASLMLAVVIGIAWRFGVTPVAKAHALERYVTAHMRHEPQALVATREVVSRRVHSLLAKYGLTIEYSKYPVVWAAECPTPHGSGLHLVVRTPGGPVTLLYLPGQQLNDRLALEAGPFYGYALNFQQGAAILIGAPGETFDRVSSELLASIDASRT